MKVRLKIIYDVYDGTWGVSVEDKEGYTLFYNRTYFKFTAWISYFIWKYITRHFEHNNDVDKWIKL